MPEVVVDERPVWSPALLEERLDSLRTWLAVLTFVSVLALALAAYALLVAGDDDTDAVGASPSRVSALSDRVDQLERRVENRATEGSVAALQTSQGELAKRLQALEQRPSDDGADDAASQDVATLRSDLDGLSRSVDDAGTAIEQLDDRVAELERAVPQP